LPDNAKNALKELTKVWYPITIESKPPNRDGFTGSIAFNPCAIDNMVDSLEKWLNYKISGTIRTRKENGK